MSAIDKLLDFLMNQVAKAARRGYLEGYRDALQAVADGKVPDPEMVILELTLRYDALEEGESL